MSEMNIFPKEFWLGISDTNKAHVNIKQVWSTDYHVIEYSAYQAVVAELEIEKQRSKVRGESLFGVTKERDMLFNHKCVLVEALQWYDRECFVTIHRKEITRFYDDEFNEYLSGFKAREALKKVGEMKDA